MDALGVWFNDTADEL
jgi:hypothetical protein